MPITAFDAARARAHFPQLTADHAFLDNAAGSFTPEHTHRAILAHLQDLGSVNAGMGHPHGDRVLDLKTRARAATATFLNAHPNEVALGPSSTALAFRLAGAFARLWGPGDEIIISELEHEANASPWRELERQGLKVHLWRARTPDMTLHVEDLRPLLNARTRLLAVTAASNTLGVTPPVREAIQVAHEVGAWTVIDDVHGAAHHLPDVRAWNADFVTFSPYKVFAPHLGAMYIRGELLAQLPVPKLSFMADDNISKIEHGTAPYASLAGWLGALDYLRDLSGHDALTRAALGEVYAAADAHERALTDRVLSGLRDLPHVTLYGPQTTEGRVATFAMRVQGLTPHETALKLAQRGVSVAAGHFYAVLPMTRLGLMPDGVVRASLAHYNTHDDITRLLDGLAALA
ncbi:cysteine desulfurase-like protein [Deinococcus maricopensis]|uniref:Cysteine desulfurase family protein n=1 Tax=Deinococcus maricopensis (strain DSM 21211 / LMG 22137 / NRRL B-23946 / LB-34) TaxID=709986 RepID=E8U7U5_DEIML|nr:cysteine desulfurase-like protein [Deinococcus maricopensis]ADV67134.1 cysteine desulfurase family protein [Deinococcus maricopensis DSM 21211]